VEVADESGNRWRTRPKSEIESPEPNAHNRAIRWRVEGFLLSSNPRCVSKTPQGAELGSANVPLEPTMCKISRVLRLETDRMSLALSG